MEKYHGTSELPSPEGTMMVMGQGRIGLPCWARVAALFEGMDGRSVSVSWRRQSDKDTRSEVSQMKTHPLSTQIQVKSNLNQYKPRQLLLPLSLMSRFISNIPS